MASTLDVRADLLIQARNSYGEVRRLSSEVRNLGEGLKTTQSAARGVLSQMLGFGAAFLGLRAITSTFTSLTRSAVGYTSELEQTKIGLQSVLMAVENTDWETAGKRAGAAFEKIREMAIKSPATSAQMFEIFNGIVGPVESAGFAMSKVLDITNDTTLAASALHIDFSEASRDINMMTRGMAGAHVKLFSMMRATGAIKQDAEAFNKLTQAQRIEAIAAGLKKFAAGGAAFGSSWAGVMSTFKDITDNLKATAFGPIMKTIAANMERFNNYILVHRVAIETFLINVGRGLANRIETVFSKVQMGFEYLVSHWDQITERFHQVVKMVREVAPQIARAAAAWELVSIGRNVTGAGITAAGGIMNAMGGIGQGAAGLAPLLGLARQSRPAPEITRALQFEDHMSGGFTEAMLAGGGGAAAGGAGAGEAAAGAGLMASAVALGPVLGLIAAALASLLAVGLAFADQWKNMMTIFGATGGQTMQMLLEAGKAIWSTLGPILTMLGSVLLIPLTVAWQVFTVLLRGFLLVLTAVFDVLGAIAGAVWSSVKPAFDFVFGLFRDLAAFFNDVFADATKFLKELKGPKVNPTEELSTEPSTDYQAWPQGTGNQIDLNKAPKGAVNINQDFRGSRISVRQEFKGDQDPDRIVMAMMSDLTRQSENRTTSGYAGALTR